MISIPEEFDKMRLAIKKSLLDQGMKEEEAESRSYAIAVDKWKKSHGGKPPAREELIKNMLIEFYAPITIQEVQKLDGQPVNEAPMDFMISGMAVDESISFNGIKYLGEELELSAPSLAGKPLLKDHENKVDNIMGRVKEAMYSKEKKGVIFSGIVKDKKMQEMISDGRVKHVSIGAVVKTLEKDKTEEKADILIARGITFKELSFVAVQGVENASFQHSFDASLKEKLDLIKKIEESDCMTEQTDTLKLQEEMKLLREANEKMLKEKSEAEAKLKEMANKMELKEKEEKILKENKELEEKINALVDKRVSEQKTGKPEFKGVRGNTDTPIDEKFIVEKNRDGTMFFSMDATAKNYGEFKAMRGMN